MYFSVDSMAFIDKCNKLNILHTKIRLIQINAVQVTKLKNGTDIMVFTINFIQCL